jgi:hypothetical protein
METSNETAKIVFETVPASDSRHLLIAGFAYQTTGTPPSAVMELVTAEMFFCLLAGFSETFVPNILRDSEKNPSGGIKAAEQAKIAERRKGGDSS